MILKIQPILLYKYADKDEAVERVRENLKKELESKNDK